MITFWNKLKSFTNTFFWWLDIDKNYKITDKNMKVIKKSIKWEKKLINLVQAFKQMKFLR